MNEITSLREENETKDQLLKELRNRMEDLDQQAKCNDVILTGLKIKPRTYAASVAVEENREKRRPHQVQHWNAR